MPSLRDYDPRAVARYNHGIPSGFAGTRKRLETAGRPIVPVEADELSKAEGGVTCCSLIFEG